MVTRISISSNKIHRSIVLVNKYKRSLKDRILQEIKNLQKSTKLLIARAPFVRLVRQILNEIFPSHNVQNLQTGALEALQESAEMYIVQYFEDATLLCLHTKRITLMQKDMELLRRLRGRNDIINK
ncbi:PREDICTED: histone H3.3-like type 1 [Ceratosolen solmsi marchali]|uniref:Histone H3.3-like type 1 n=1 Tax=Ceratosolen solmsi marchali TaxID=326594 RepID=A0AAJ6YTC2_9HYME|nr:PREDICTED: histone H3.3-like type 1 [Ceratosolen solmsi marchali]